MLLLSSSVIVLPTNGSTFTLVVQIPGVQKLFLYELIYYSHSHLKISVIWGFSANRGLANHHCLDLEQ